MNEHDPPRLCTPWAEGRGQSVCPHGAKHREEAERATRKCHTLPGASAGSHSLWPVYDFSWAWTKAGDSAGLRTRHRPQNCLSRKHLFILLTNTPLISIYNYLFWVRNSRWTQVPALASSYRRRWPCWGAAGRLVGPLQEGPAAPQALLVHGLKVGLAPLEGGKESDKTGQTDVPPRTSTRHPTWLTQIGWSSRCPHRGLWTWT